MKKVLSLIIAVVMVLSCSLVPAFAADEIKVTINGNELKMDQPPVIVDSRTLVPLRAIFEGLGATVAWDDATKTATGVKDGKEIKITIDSKIATVDGVQVTLDVPAQILSSRTMVPVRFISESLGANVSWDNVNRAVIITGTASKPSGEGEVGENGLKIVKKWDFENVTSFKHGVDFVVGGGYNPTPVFIKDTYASETGNGKSLILTNRTKSIHRLKLKDAFSKEDLGKTFTVTGEFYLPDVSAPVYFGVFSDTGVGSYSMMPKVQKTLNNAPKGEVVTLSFTYTHTDETITQIGVGQPDAASVVAATMCVDNITIYEGTVGKK